MSEDRFDVRFDPDAEEEYNRLGLLGLLGLIRLERRLISLRRKSRLKSDAVLFLGKIRRIFRFNS